MAPTPTSMAAGDQGPSNNGAIASQSRKRKEREGDQDTTQRRPSKKLQYLRPHTKRISQSLITSKWASLPADAQHQVRELFKAAKRPVVLSRRDERQRREAEAVLDHMVRRLEKQLPRMPFPPKSKDIHFDLDKLLERKRQLESQITPAVHAMEILKAEIAREEAALEKDRRALRHLEKDARAEQREREKQAKKIHPLLEDAGGDGAEDTAELINLHTPQRRASALEAGLDPDLQPLLNQLGSHLESMRANTEQLHGLGSALARAEVALSTVMPQGY